MMLLRGIWAWLSSESSRPLIGLDYTRLGALLGKAIEEKDNSLLEMVRRELGHRFPSNQRSALEQRIADYTKEERLIPQGAQLTALPDPNISSDPLTEQYLSNKDSAKESETAHGNTHGQSAAATAIPLSESSSDTSSRQELLEPGKLGLSVKKEDDGADLRPVAGLGSATDATPNRSSPTKPPTRTLSTVRFHKRVDFTVSPEDSEAVYCIRTATSGVVVSMNLNHPLGKIVFSAIDSHSTSREGRILRDLISALALAEAESIHSRSSMLRGFRRDTGRILAECSQEANSEEEL